MNGPVCRGTYIPSRDGDADAGERCGPALDPGDAGPPERGEHVDLHPAKHPGIACGTCEHASGGAAEEKTDRALPMKNEAVY